MAAASAAATLRCSCRHHERSRRCLRRIATPPAEGRLLDSSMCSQRKNNCLAAEGLGAGMGQDQDTSRNGCEGWILLMSNVGICHLSPPLVSQIQKLLGEEDTVRRQVRCSGKIPQKESAPAMPGEPVALESSADGSLPPMQAFR